jgi:hypothetical protein
MLVFGNTLLSREAETTITKAEIVCVFVREERQFLPDQRARLAVWKEGWF